MMPHTVSRPMPKKTPVNGMGSQGGYVYRGDKPWTPKPKKQDKGWD